jgi:hypothetical protein
VLNRLFPLVPGKLPYRHAWAHYEETEDHPVAMPLHAGASYPWCYVHQRPVALV